MPSLILGFKTMCFCLPSNLQRIGKIAGARSITFHAAFYLKQDPNKVYEVVKQELKKIVDTLKDEGNDIWIKPELTGNGLGEEFVSDCIRFAKSHYKLKKQAIKLDAALFNRRAIKVYERVGFSVCSRITKNTHIGKVDFLRMEKTLND